MASVKGHFNYFQWESKFEEEKPYYLYTDPPPGQPASNFATEPGQPEVVHNVRGREQEFDLDKNGFAFLRQQYPHSLRDINEATIHTQYLPSCEAMIKEILKQDCEVFWFDWRKRSSDDRKSKFEDGAVINLEDRMVTLAPIRAVHVDQTPAAAIDRVYRHLPDRAEELLKKRFRIINVWRPIGNPVESAPLAYIDGSTVPEEKLVEVDVVRRSFPGESYYPLEHSGYKWHFLDKQSPDEVLFLKMNDSDQSAPSKCCPHASFTQSADPAAKPRESIEARALVFTDR